MIYLDANVIIRLIEADDDIRKPIEDRIKNEAVIATSFLSRIECLCRPMRDQDRVLLEIFETFFVGNQLLSLPIDEDVINQATHIRAYRNFKIPDAIHLATAMVGGATAFLTADKDLAKFDGIKVELV